VRVSGRAQGPRKLSWPFLSQATPCVKKEKTTAPILR